jgi:hypothetical protein
MALERVIRPENAILLGTNQKGTGHYTFLDNSQGKTF